LDKISIKDIQNYFLSFFGSIEEPKIEIEEIEKEIEEEC